MVGSGEAFGGIALGEEDVKAKITMKPRRDRRLGGGGKWRERGGVERREGGNAEERLVKISRALRRTAERTAWKTGFKCPLASCWMVRQRPGRMWAEGESEGLQTLGIVVVLCSSLKLLHYLGLIDLSDGKRTLELPCFIRMCFSA